MTERVGRSARWATVALVSPLAAAALAVATSWGAAHPPAASGKNSSTDQADQASDAGDPAGQTVAETVALDKTLLALQRQASTEQARVVRLQKILNRLNARTRALARAPLPSFSGASSTGVSVSAGGGTVYVAAPPAVAAAPAPAAPATHTSTGAS